MTKVAKSLTNATLGRLVDYIRWRMITEGPKPIGVVAETLQRAVADSADYADSRMASALGFTAKESFWRHAFRRDLTDGLLVEFGVWKGRSINFFAAMTNRELYGFDSFEGLKEDWRGWAVPKGYFSLNGALPEVASNVRLIKGWFDQTLPTFLKEHPDPFSFVHIDCDTYEATSTILEMAHDRFVKGTVVVFDEYFGYRGWRTGEYKAWQEFVTGRSLRYEYVGFTDHAVSAVVG